MLVIPFTSDSSAFAAVGSVSFQPSAPFCRLATPPATVEIFSSSILSDSTPAKTFGLLLGLLDGLLRVDEVQVRQQPAEQRRSE